MIETVDIMGIAVQSGSTIDIVEYIDERIRNRTVTKIAFLNANLSNILNSNASLRDKVSDFIVLNDGIGLDIAKRILHGSKFRENLNGTDFTTAYLDKTKHNLRIFLLGALPEVISESSDLITKRWPRHSVIGFHHGFLLDDEYSELLDSIHNFRPDIIIVGMGNPLQEKWIASHIPQVCSCGIGVGAWFDFLTGRVPRAPRYVRALRIEWAYRFFIEPRRLAKRYLLGNFEFIARLLLFRLRAKRNR